MVVRWIEKQQKVIESRNRNLPVSVAAGSGETAVLVERIIRMISEGEHPPDIGQLLIMTFTSAAAAEMRERIGAAMEQKLKERPEDKHLWFQVAPIPQAMIAIIGSFCLNIIRNHFNSLDIDPAFRIGGEGELALLKSDVLGEMLGVCYEEGRKEFAGFMEHFGRGKSDWGIEDVILRARQSSQSHPWPGEWLFNCGAELGEGNLEEMEQSLRMQLLFQDTAWQMEELSAQFRSAPPVCGEESGPQAYEPMLLSGVGKLEVIEQAASQGNFEVLYQSLKNMNFDRLTSIRSKDIDGEKRAFATACRDRAKKAVGECRDLYGAQSPAEMVESARGTKTVIAELLNLAGTFDEAYRVAKREWNALDFNDLEHLALEVLLEKVPEEAQEQENKERRPSPAADELSRQFEEILMDEYRDGNYVQEALIISISRERFGHPSVFMVGDVRQSTYRFRLARPELFMEKYGSYSVEDGPYQMIELQQNFRSRESVLTSVNDIFYQIMIKNLGGVTYTKDTALYPGASLQEVGGENVDETLERKEGTSLSVGVPTEPLMVGTGAKVLKQLDEDTLDYIVRELEIKMIAKRIRELVSEEKGLLVWDKTKETYRKVRLGDMVILLHNMTGQSEVFVNALMNEGISASAQTRTGYFNTVEMGTVLNLLSVIDNPMQDIPLAAAMCSPIVGMDDEEMAWMTAVYKKNSKKGQDRGVHGVWTLWMDEEWEHPGTVPEIAAASIRRKLAYLRELLGELRDEARHLPIHELLHRAYRKDGYYDYVSAIPVGETRRGNLDMLVEKTAAYEATSYKGLLHFVRYTEKLEKYDMDSGGASVAGGQDHMARIMNIHKSRGLELPVVFLVDMGKRFNKQDTYGRILLDADLGVAAGHLDLDLRVKAPTLKKQVLKRCMELETMGEELKVLYVAMTRAKEKLIITTPDKSLGNRCSRWKDSMAVGGQILYTVLATAGPYLGWVLMAYPVVPKSHLEVTCAQVRELIGEEVGRQVMRRMTKENLLGVDSARVYDREVGEKLEQTASYKYPHMNDIGLYAMIFVSKFKGQSQTGRVPEAIGTSGTDTESAVLEVLAEPERETSGSSGRGALRGTVYYATLEHISFVHVQSLEETEQALEALVEKGCLDQESREPINGRDIRAFPKNPLGKRMVKAQEEGRIYKEQQSIIGIPAREMDRGDSDELVLIQGIIDAYLGEPDGLVLIDHKTDRVPGNDREQGATMLTERYWAQLDYYERALIQLTGKRVKERMIHSLALQRSIKVQVERRL